MSSKFMTKSTLQQSFDARNLSIETKSIERSTVQGLFSSKEKSVDNSLSTIQFNIPNTRLTHNKKQSYNSYRRMLSLEAIKNDAANYN